MHDSGCRARSLLKTASHELSAYAAHNIAGASAGANAARSQVDWSSGWVLPPPPPLRPLCPSPQAHSLTTIPLPPCSFSERLLFSVTARVLSGRCRSSTACPTCVTSPQLALSVDPGSDLLPAPRGASVDACGYVERLLTTSDTQLLLCACLAARTCLAAQYAPRVTIIHTGPCASAMLSLSLQVHDDSPAARDGIAFAVARCPRLDEVPIALSAVRPCGWRL